MRTNAFDVISKLFLNRHYDEVFEILFSCSFFFILLIEVHKVFIDP